MTVAARTASEPQDWSQIASAPYPLLVDGELLISTERLTLDVVYPFNNEVVGKVYAAGHAEVERAVVAAKPA